MKDEAEWLACTDPNAMLEWLEGPCRTGGDAVPQGGRLISDRKRRLFACACARLLWGRMPDQRSRVAVEIAEVAADVPETLTAVATARAADALTEAMRGSSGDAERAWLACAALAGHWSTWELSPGVLASATQAALLREVVGNPFRPVTLPVRHREGCDATPGAAERAYSHCTCPCPWLTPDVMALASAAYDDRDFALLPLVADALVDAGCDHEGLLGHLRQRHAVRYTFAGASGYYGSHATRGQAEDGAEACRRHFSGLAAEVWVESPAHVRGCWAADLLLGKE